MGLPHQLHASFERQLISLPTIARVAAGDEVLPCRSTPARTRHNVVEREVARGESLSAILAGIAITQQVVFTRQSPRLVRFSALFQKPNDRRYPGGMQEMPVLFLRQCYPL